MKKHKFLLFFILSFVFSFSFSQSNVSIFILDSYNKVDSTYISNEYSNIGFNPIITIGNINTTLNTNNYDIVFISEGYFYDGTTLDWVSDFISDAERQIIENFLDQGGHIVWQTENWENYPQSLQAYTTINNTYETNVSEGPFFNNDQFGTSVFRIHPSIGPAGLSVKETILSTGNFSTMLNIPNCSKLYSPNIYDNSGNEFFPCSHSVMAVFPARPVTSEGSLIISSEINIPFKEFEINGATLYNNELDSTIALLHYQLLVDQNTEYVNDWSDSESSMNEQCPTIVADYTHTNTKLCVGDTIFFTHVDGGTLFYTQQDTGRILLTLNYFQNMGSCYDDTTILAEFTDAFVDAGEDKTICDGDAFTLRAINPSNASLNWNNEVIDDQSFIPQESLTYTVVSSKYGCTYMDSVSINIVKKPIIHINQNRYINACAGDELVLNATTEKNSNISWNNNYTNNTTLVVDKSIFYVVTANIGECNAKDSIQITAIELPKIYAGTDKSICLGDTLSLKAQSNSTQIKWDNNINNNIVFSPTETTTFTVEAVMNGCTNRDSIEITVIPRPLADYEITINKEFYDVTRIDFLNSTYGGTNNSYVWYFGDSINQSTEFSPTYFFNSSETNFVDVRLTATNPSGCVGSVIKTFRIDKNTINFAFVPNAFTPNDDYTNDTFKPTFYNAPEKYLFKIFNRWGKLIFETEKVEIGWDGKYKNRLVQDGTYVYKILHDEKLVTGNFLIISNE